MSVTQHARVGRVRWATRFTLTLSLLLTLLTAAPPGLRADTPTPAPDVAAPAASVEVSPTAVTVSGLQTPNGLAISPYDNWIYVTSRNNDRVLKLDGTTYAVLASAPVGDLPWGVARHGTKLYVANFGSGTVSVLRWDTLETLKTIDVGANSQPTFVQSMWSVQKIVVALHGFSQIAVIDAATDQVDLQVRPVGTGAWGLGAEDLGTGFSPDSATVPAWSCWTAHTGGRSRRPLACNRHAARPPGRGVRPHLRQVRRQALRRLRPQRQRG